MDYDGRSVSGECCLYDIDPELIRKSVRKLMQQVAQVEREKEEFKVQLQAARKELDDAANQQTRSENKMSKLQQMLRNANEEKANLESKLAQKQLALHGVEDALKLKTDELNALIDKYKSLELQFSSVSEQKSQIEVRHVFLLTFYDFSRPKLRTFVLGTPMLRFTFLHTLSRYLKFICLNMDSYMAIIGSIGKVETE